jgi:hypothetical protein
MELEYLQEGDDPSNKNVLLEELNHSQFQFNHNNNNIFT